KPAARILRGLTFDELFQDPIRLAVSPKHPLAQHRTVTVVDIIREPIVAYSLKDYPDAHDMLNHVLAPAETKPRIIEEHDSVSCLIAVVESGTGGPIVTETLPCTAGVRLKLIPISPAPTPLLIGIVYLRKGFSPAGERFLKFAMESSKELAPTS